MKYPTRDARILPGRPAKPIRQPFDYTTIQIEKGVQIPPIRQTTNPAYVLAGQMEIEDSILIPTKNASAIAAALNRLYGKGSSLSRKEDREYSRVWRIRNKEERGADKLVR